MIRPMLAVEADLTKIIYPVLVSPKLDGIRCLIIDGKPRTRNGKEIPNRYINEYLSGKAWLEGFDGELVLSDSSKPFNAVSSAIMSRDGEPDFIYKVFDKISTYPFGERYSRLDDIVEAKNQSGEDRVYIVPHYYCGSGDELLKYETLFLASGFEGVMIRDPSGPYKHGRSTQNEGYLLKLKRFADAEARVIGFVERMHNANEATVNALGYTERSNHKANKMHTNMLGALICDSKDWSSPFEIGTGFTDDLRMMIWDNQDHYRDALVTYKYQPCGTVDRPRFPVFKGFRSDI